MTPNTEKIIRRVTVLASKGFLAVGQFGQTILRLSRKHLDGNGTAKKWQDDVGQTDDRRRRLTANGQLAHRGLRLRRCAQVNGGGERRVCVFEVPTVKRQFRRLDAVGWQRNRVNFA